MTLAMWPDTDAIAQGRPDPRDWDSRAARTTRCPTPSTHRLRRPQGQPEGHQGLARPRQARRRDHHAQPQDLRQRQAELPGGLGRGHAARRHRRPTRSRSSRKLYAAGARARPRRARRDDDLRRRRRSATCTSPGRTRRTSRCRRPAARSRSSTRRSASSPSRTSPSSTPTSSRKGTASRGQGLPRVPLHAARARRSSPRTSTVRPIPTVLAKHRGDLPGHQALHDRRGREGLGRRQRQVLRRRRDLRQLLQAEEVAPTERRGAAPP